MKKAKIALFLVASWASLVGCSRKYLSVAETDVVVTFQAEGRDYSELGTYVLPETVVDLCPEESDDSGEGAAPSPSEGGAGGGAPEIPGCKEADHRYDDILLSALRENLNGLGYREIEDPETETPDVALLVGIVARDNWYLASGGGYCYPYYYYWGCWYPTYTYPYNLPTSAYLIDMAIVDESTDGELVSGWTAVMQGLQSQSDEKTPQQRIEEAVERAFSQSPYLAEGGEE